jgi:ATP-dependent Clp protease ATP-binding subunit ClpC
MFAVHDIAELGEIAQLELAQYFFGNSLEEILRYQANRQEAIDELEVEFQPAKLAEKVAQEKTDSFWALRQSGIPLSDQAGEQRLPRAYYRDAEVRKVLTTLAGEERPSLVLIGPPGVGKTAIIHEVVRRIARKECDEVLRGRQVWSMSASALMAGTKYIGQWEEKAADLIAEVRKKRIILFMEDLPLVVDAGRHEQSENNAAEMLKPYIQSGDVVLVGESTPERWRYAEQRHAGFVSQFQVLPVAPTDESDTLRILNAVCQQSERKNAIRIAPAAIEAAVELTNRFLPYREQPGKAIRLLEQAIGDLKRRQSEEEEKGGRVQLGRKEVTAAFTRQTGLPEFILADDAALELDVVRRHFTERVVGQQPAAEAMVNLIAMIKAGLNDPAKPLGSFLFIGPTGVGKTQMAKTLARYLFGDEGRLLRYDMSEYSDPAGVRRLIGQPGSGQEGELTGAVRSKPFCVVLLDEFEKANELIYDLFLQVLGEGRLTDATGRVTSFQNAIIIMTSNLGARARDQRALGLVADEQAEAGREPAYWQGKVEQHFRPEFVNRLDQIVAFGALSPATMRQIARRELGEVLLRKGLTRRNLLVEIDDSVLDLLMEQGFSPAYGARPLKRAIEQNVVLPLARLLAERTRLETNLLRLNRKGSEVILGVTRLAGAAEEKPVLLEPGPLAADQKQRRLEAGDLVGGFADLRRTFEDWGARDAVLEMRNERDSRLSETGKPTFWDDPERARANLARFYFLERLLKRLQQLTDQAAFLEELAGLVRRQRDASYRAELAESQQRLARDAAFLEIELLCAHIVRNHGARISLRPIRSAASEEAGAAWPLRLAAMYLRWAQRKGYEIEAVAIPARGGGKGSAGGEGKSKAGLKWQQLTVADFDLLMKEVGCLSDVREVLILLSGANVYGFLKGEAGLHRLTEQRPSGERSQQFTTVSVAPWEEAENGGLEQLLAAGDAGRTLRGGADPGASSEEIVRSYHLEAKRYVRDTRTDVRHNDPSAVFDGDLDDFILTYLRQVEPVTAWENREVVPADAG